VNILTIS